ncbi:MAG TPA: DUF2203 domain-containing protein [Candidatus Nitrosotalea sp.]|nr:DUF2203 domain-containing protein [Candidatus Nitrosotalea sp.]
MFSHFTVEEANAVLPSVIKKYRELVDLKNQIIKTQTEMETDPKYMSSLKEHILKKQEFNVVLANFYKSVAEIENTGVVVKSLEEGLLDFPSLRFNEEIWLCWKDGETEIKFWHGKDEGFNGRKPLETFDAEKLR